MMFVHESKLKNVGFESVKTPTGGTKMLRTLKGDIKSGIHLLTFGGTPSGHWTGVQLMDNTGRHVEYGETVSF